MPNLTANVPIYMYLPQHTGKKQSQTCSFQNQLKRFRDHWVFFPFWSELKYVKLVQCKVTNSTTLHCLPVVSRPQVVTTRNKSMFLNATGFLTLWQTRLNFQTEKLDCDRHILPDANKRSNLKPRSDSIIVASSADAWKYGFRTSFQDSTLKVCSHGVAAAAIFFRNSLKVFTQCDCSSLTFLNN